MESWTWNHPEERDMQTVHPSTSVNDEDGLTTNNSSFQINDLIYIAIFIFAALATIVVGLIVLVLVKTYLRSRAREKLRQKNNSSQCYTTTINPSPQLMRSEHKKKEGTVEIRSSNRQCTTIPEERSIGDISDCQVSIYMEPDGCKDMRTNHRQKNTRQESDIMVKSHRQRDASQKSDTTMEISDDTDEGMKDQCQTSSCVYSKRLPHHNNISSSNATDLPGDEVPAANSTSLNKTTNTASESSCSVPPKKYQLQLSTKKLPKCSAKHQENQSNLGKTPSLTQRKPSVLMPLQECPVYESQIHMDNMQSAM